MKADLNKILAALQQIEQNPNFGDRSLVTPERDDTAPNQASEPINQAATPSSSTPIPPLQPNRKAPALPTFNLSQEESLSEAPTTNVVAAATPLPTRLMEEAQQVVQQIENLYMEGPIVDGWLESYPCESTTSNNDTVDYVKASSLEQDKVVWEAPRSCYRLNGVSQTGQPWSYPCPLEQLPSVSVAIARYEKLLQLLARKRNLETRLKQL